MAKTYGVAVYQRKNSKNSTKKYFNSLPEAEDFAKDKKYYIITEYDENPKLPGIITFSFGYYRFKSF
jgi:hypothetical protein